MDKQALLSFALQFGEDTFNRAKLLNVGFMEALKDDEEYDCFIFSDVDLIPMDDRNLYRCYEQPRHFAVGMDKFGFRWVPWGVSAQAGLESVWDGIKAATLDCHLGQA